MGTEITVDSTDTAPCNLRCAISHPRKYCAAYPKCIAGYVHRVQALFARERGPRQTVREEKSRSPLGGHSTTRILHDPDAGSTLEEIELHCQTLNFESLLTKDAAGKQPPRDSAN